MHHELNILFADEVLVPVLDFSATDPLLVEPGSIGRPEILNEVVIALSDDGSVLARDFAGVDDEIAMPTAPNQKPVFIDSVSPSLFADEEKGPQSTRGRQRHIFHADSDVFAGR